MSQRNRRRLANLLLDFADGNELKCTVDSSGQRANVGFLAGGKLVQMKFDFDDIQGSYDFTASLYDTRGYAQDDLALTILRSRPIRGITERIIGNKLVVLGGRDYLNELDDDFVISSFRDDISRVANYFKQASTFFE